MEQRNDGVAYELKLALYNMIRVCRGLIDNRGTILSARKRIEEAEKILNKNFNIHDVLRSDCSATLNDHAALQAKVERYQSLLQVVHQKAKEGIFPHLPVETMGAQKCIEIDAMLNEALSAGEWEKEDNNG